MADTTYISNKELPDSIAGFEQYQSQDKNLITSFQVNSLFNPISNFVELHIVDLADTLLESHYNYNRYSLLGNAQSSGTEGASVLTIDPIQDSLFYGYSFGGVKLLYHFLDDLYTIDNTISDFYIDSISPDRTEISLLTHNILPEDLVKITDSIKTKIKSQSYFNEFRLDFKDNNLLIGVNIDTLDTSNGKSVVVKLYEPLPDIFKVKSTLNIVEVISDSIAYEIDYELGAVPETFKTLRSANFDIDIQEHSVVPSKYFDYTELLSYNTGNSNSEIYSTLNEKGIELSIDYTDYSNFIHFSSAQERLLNFKYKIDLLNSYSQSLSTISTVNGTISGSSTYYSNLYQGIINNFDHYERFLYYESGSSSWPKVNNTRPYVNQTSAQALNWFNSALTDSVGYDNSNYSALIDTIPSYLREDENNENYLTFIYMVGQHFDNLWIYSKAVTDRYDGDNRINNGISKDLVAEALKSFGVKLYTSNKSIEDLFTTFIGQAYQSGSEVINHYITGSITGSNASIQPTSYNNYQKEVQKRIYHNIPLLLKSKGTERGVRALINCFGIPSDILQIKLYGGKNQEKLPYFGEQDYSTSSLDKIRLDNTGSIVGGNVLSNYTSIVKRDKKYTDDLHNIEIGFSPTDNINNYIVSQSTSTFNIDDYLGDPRNLTLDNYSGLYKEASNILGNLDTYNLQDYVRLIKFFDNTVFKMIKDFIPARAVATTGIVIKPNLLDRSKAKSVALEGTIPEYTASIDTAFLSGSHGGSFRLTSRESSTAWTGSVQTPFGLGVRTDHLQEEPKFNGEFSSSLLSITNGEMNSGNPLKIQNPISTTNQVNFYIESPSGICALVSIGPIVINNSIYQNYSIQNDLVTISPSGVVYTSTPSLTISSAGVTTFPRTNYISYSVTASRPELDPICSGSIRYDIRYCDLGLVGGTPTTVDKDVAVNITNWFTTGSNTNTSYTASWPSGNVVGITTPTAYTFPQSNGTAVTLTLNDNIIGGCTTSKIVTVVYVPPPVCPIATSFSPTLSGNILLSPTYSSGGYGGYATTVTYTGTGTASFSLAYRYYNSNGWTSAFLSWMTLTLTSGQTFTFSTSGPTSYANYYAGDLFIGCESNKTAPYVYYATLPSDTADYTSPAHACSITPATYPIYCNAPSLAAITAGTVFYRDAWQKEGWISGGTRPAYIALSATNGGAPTRVATISGINNSPVSAITSC